MACGLLTPPTKTTPQLLLSTISRHPVQVLKFLKNPSFSHSFSSSHLRFLTHSSRFLCCSSSQYQHDPIGIEKYKDIFSRRMAMAGLKPHHRIALGVSGGPDSMALCVLAAAWKTQGTNVSKKGKSKFVDGLLAIVVDHGLRAESKDEANLVSCRVAKMGIRCEIVHCEWSDGKPKQGQLQEAAREKRYESLQKVCIRQQIGVLLIAHHADDQAELFIIRLSRGSGVLGLAGMAFTSQLFAKCQDFNCQVSSGHGILLARPLLDFSKEDMYQICRGAHQEWVEDPTNWNPTFTRNRIRMSLSDISSSSCKVELLALISACRRTRQYVENICSDLMNRAVTIMPEGYAVIDVVILNPTEVEDLILSKFISVVLQFIAQRQRIIRGNALKLILDYTRAIPCKTSLTAAGCYLCPAPGSKGAKVLVCCSVNSCFPLKVEVFEGESEKQSCSISDEVEKIVADGKSFSDQSIPQDLDMTFLNMTSSESILINAKRQNILNESTYLKIASLQKTESENFRCGTGAVTEAEMRVHTGSNTAIRSSTLYIGQIAYFMDRFLVRWNLSKKVPFNLSFTRDVDYHQDTEVERQYCCSSCIISHVTKVKVRHMIDKDWLYLSELLKHDNPRYPSEFLSPLETAVPRSMCLHHVKLSASKALLALKSIPVGARRGLPVLVDAQGQLLSIPSVGFEHCPCLKASAVFKPRTPLGGGHSSFI